MDMFRDGFAIEGHAIAWGATLDEAARCLQATRGEHARLELACRDVAGLPALRAALDAPAWNRPVTGATFELPPDPAVGAPGLPWLAALSERLGPPAQLEEYDLRDHPYPAGGVRGNARWDGDDVVVHLTVYGGLRDGAAGSLAALWSPERAAAPYVAGWECRCEALARRLDAGTELHVFTVEYPLEPYRGPARLPRPAQRALYAPELLDTPPLLASRLGRDAFAVWEHPASGHWGLSTRWDTREVAPGETVHVDWIELQPAKGGGWAGIELDSWSVRDRPDSRQVRDAVERIRRLAGARIEHHEGHDC